MLHEKKVCTENAHQDVSVAIVKDYLSKQVFKVDTSIVDQVLMQLWCALDVLFRFFIFLLYISAILCNPGKIADKTS